MSWNTIEWSGDWADESEQWTEKAKNRLGYTPQEDTQSEKADGIFWMNHLDFISEFKYFYACRVLNEEEGWNNCVVSGAWKVSDKTAAGFPGKFVDLPQFKITVYKPCQGFIQMT